MKDLKFVSTVVCQSDDSILYDVECFHNGKYSDLRFSLIADSAHLDPELDISVVGLPFKAELFGMDYAGLVSAAYAFMKDSLRWKPKSITAYPFEKVYL